MTTNNNINTPLVSVIVPVYNTGKYLRKCLDSIINQTYKNIEIILVDDGSTDESPHICDEYAVKDKRIKVIHQKNCGSFGARKNGLEASSGDYIQFVDSDDWINLDMCEKLVKKGIECNADIVFCDILIITNEKTYTQNNTFSEESKELLRNMLAGKFPWSSVNKLTKRSTAIESIKNNTIGDDIAEDMLMSVTSLLTNPKIAYINESLYNYNRIVESSLMINSASGGSELYPGRNNIKRMYDLFKEKNLYNEFSYDFNRLVSKVKFDLLLEGRIAEAREFYPFVHKDKRVYSFFSKSTRWIYYGAFNWGIFGKLIFLLYIKARTFRINLRRQ